MVEAFPNSTFPLGAVHEFLCAQPEDLTATVGFITGLQSATMGNSGAVLWISSSCKIFPQALKSFGLLPERIIFLHLKKEKEILWAIEEALKCSALSFVVGELKEIDFTSSRRLQLAVEQSQVTGFIIRSGFRKLSTTACVSRWRVTPLTSVPVLHNTNHDGVDELPGIGFPKWKVELLRMRNGKPGSWAIQWIKGRFVFEFESRIVTQAEQKKAG
ncbi:MAG: ImuA family protein [Bacteroidota bacterium]